MRRKLLALMIALPLVGCSRPPEPVRVPTTPWESLDLPGKTLTLVDASERQFFEFHEGGAVVAELGRKNGAVTAPILVWKIERNALVITGPSDSGIIERLRAPTVTGTVLTATRKSGAKATYQLGPPAPAAG